MRRISPWMSFEKGITLHCLEIVDIRSYFDPHFPAFGLNTERYGVSRSRFFPHSVRMWKKADENNSEYKHFLRSVDYSLFNFPTQILPPNFDISH